ncbi:hypothetical protein CIHG_06693 [Coccidioides immitis H538.4]|uniref:Uncharacterized protein n=3 Tax=Coccidioides immitis TaxID=5501 RepID=A0A0J8QZ00_COCIT|nr:hypothetical protein CIRG_01584 [Coccidioides immitis RMSCC 2394]KMU77290.1 hypothetical protein CISG_06331 [Coccidioides immitis RMSCC 3703]KMU88891.1 hypothetical protein CIHG_06693 [Coccidioides immitis H538.4]
MRRNSRKGQQYQAKRLKSRKFKLRQHAEKTNGYRNSQPTEDASFNRDNIGQAYGGETDGILSAPAHPNPMRRVGDIRDIILWSSAIERKFWCPRFVLQMRIGALDLDHKGR